MMSYFLTFDVGTTAMKCILFDSEFNEVFCANKEYSIEAREQGMAEIDADIYFDTFRECVDEIWKAGVSPNDIVSITFTTQGETLIPVDKEGKALCKAIVWLDTIAETEADVIREKISAGEMYRRTGLGGIDGALSAAKILWLCNHQQDLYAKTYKFLLLEDYLIFRLTGRFVSEKSLQSSTGWYDIIEDSFYSAMLNACSLNAEKLPEVLPCGSIVATVKSDVAMQCGLSEKTIITTGAMDQISSAIGVGNVIEGMCTETTGTALVVGATTAKPIFDESNPITIYKHFDEKYIYMPYSNTAGMTLKWFKDKIMPYAADEAKTRGISVYDVVTEYAAQSPVGSKGVIMLPQLSEAGAFIGLSLATEAADLARSVLEGVAYMLRDIIEQIETQGVVVDELYSLGGGSYSQLWCQIKADVCKKKIVCTDYAQTTSLGAAILGAVAVGKYKSVDEALKLCKTTKKVFVPNESNFEVYDRSYESYKKYLKIHNTQEDV